MSQYPVTQPIPRLQSASYLAILSHHSLIIDEGLRGEVAMGTVIDFAYHDHIDRHQLWDRFERADLFEQYLDLQAQGVSQRQAARQLQVPRSTLQAWQSWNWLQVFKMA